ncbi:Basement membrane, partial [Brachionus plicatilis]
PYAEILDHKLKFINFNQTNCGSYVCSVDEFNQSQVDIFLVNNGEIEINGLLEKKIISDAKINDSINQSCLAIINGVHLEQNLEIQWYDQYGGLLENKENVDIQNYVTRANPLTKISTLKLKNINLKNFGSYECRISYHYMIKTLEFDIINPYDKIQPSFDKDKIEVYQGDSFELICSTDEEIEKEWLINNQKAENFLGLEISGNILVVSNASLEMNGSVSCNTVKDGVKASKAVLLIVKIVQSVNIISNLEIEDNVISVESGSFLKIECFDPLNESVHWSKDNDPKFSVDHGILFFNKTQLDNSGFYTCQSDNHEIKPKNIEITIFEKEIMTTTLTGISVTDTSEPVTERMSKQVTVKNDSILEFENGIDLIVYCITDEDKDRWSNYIWTKINKVKLPENVDRDKNKLIFKNFNRDNQDTYQCTYGETLENSLNLTLFIKGAIIDPTAKLDDNNIELLYGQNKTIECTVTGYPKPNITWLFKNELINDTKNFETFNNVLLIKNANENTNGEVTCRAIGKDNIFAEDSALIFVNDNRILLKIQPQESIVQIGSDINLSCDIIQPNIGDLENLTYVWSKDSIILNDFNQRQFNFRTKSLNESGLYSCQVFDGDRKSEPSNSNIKVIPNPNSITIISNHKIDYNNSKLVVKESDSVNLKCEAEADDSQVHWNINSTLNGLSQKFGKELFLNSILQNQSGNYECVVKIPQVEKELRYAINVYAVKYEPLIIEINTSYLKNILRLDCNV